jgi:hypothetical protein
MTNSNTVHTTTFAKPDNILQFPKTEGFLGNTSEEIQQTLSNNTAQWIERILPTVCSATFNEISKFGLNLFDPMLSLDMLMIQEACRSLMMASMKIDHPFQSLSRSVLEFDEDGGVNIFSWCGEDSDEDEDDLPTG